MFAGGLLTKLGFINKIREVNDVKIVTWDYSFYHCILSPPRENAPVSTQSNVVFNSIKVMREHEYINLQTEPET